VTLIELLFALDERRVRLALTDSGRLHTTARPGAITPELASQIRAHHDHLVWTVIGRQTGHAWAPCTHCGQALLIDPCPRQAGKTVWPACAMTPGCPGRHTAQTATATPTHRSIK
jgi:hypothetical protein